METILKQSFEFWEKLTPAQKQLLSENARTVTYQKGQNLYSLSNECLGVLLLLKGELRAYMLSDEGREVTLYRLKKNDICILSASCILKNITFEVLIDAEVESQALLLSVSAFERLQNENVYVENFALKTAVRRFSDVMWAMEQMLFYKLEKRLALFLLDESNLQNSNNLNLTHEQIAKYIGSAREVVSRTLKTFEKQNILTLKNGKIILLNKEKLNGLS